MAKKSYAGAILSTSNIQSVPMILAEKTFQITDKLHPDPNKLYKGVPILLFCKESKLFYGEAICNGIIPLSSQDHQHLSNTYPSTYNPSWVEGIILKDIRIFPTPFTLDAVNSASPNVKNGHGYSCKFPGFIQYIEGHDVKIFSALGATL